MKKLILLFICLTQALTFQLKAEKIDTTKVDSQAIAKTFAQLDKENRYTDQLAYADMNVLPLGFKQTINNNEFAIAISSIRFLESHAEVTLFARMKTAQGKTKLFFAAQGIKFSYSGNIIGDAALMLIQDMNIPVNEHTQLYLKGGKFDTKDGLSSSKTYVKIDCKGFKELSIAGSVILSKSILTRVSKDGTPSDKPVSADFQTTITGWNDLLLDISLPLFQIKGLDGFIFNLSHAVLDFSDFQNSSSMKFPDGYTKKYLMDGNAKLWRGIYAQRISITLPKEFSKNGDAATFEAENLLIDENGVSGIFSAENVLPIELGSASGWSFSIDKFWLGLEAHKITQAGFDGMIGLPISDSTYLAYHAQILGNKNYQLIVSPKDTLDFKCMLAKAHLLPNSYVKITVENDKFLPEAYLNGFLTVKAPTSNKENASEKLVLDSVEFRKLTLQTKEPYLAVEYLGYKGTIKMMGFPVSLSKIELKSTAKEFRLGFDLSLNLDEQHISANTRFNIKGKYVMNTEKGKWVYDGIGLEDLVLKDCSIAGILKLNGSLKIMDQDPVYGDGFYGDLSMEFSEVLKNCKISMAAAFGKKDDYRYWFVDGSVVLSKVINIAGPVGINGFGGGVSTRMKRTIGKGLGLSKTGCGYIPDKDMGLGLKAAVFFATEGNFMGGEASFEIQFNRHGGVDLIGFYGYAEFMANIPGLDQLSDQISGKFQQLTAIENDFLEKHHATEETLRQLKQNEPSKAAEEITDSKEKASNANFAASLGILYDFSAKTLHANFDVYVNAAGGLLRGTASGNRAGWAVLHVSPQEWYIYIGVPDNRIGLQVGIPGIATLKTTAYFMLGDNLPGSPPPPPAVARILGENNESFDYMRDLNALKSGKGIAFGSSLEFSTGDLTFLILYARFDAGVGFDIMMKDYRDAQCRGRSGPIGINGWYANGQAYAYLGGELGVKVNLWFIKTKIPIIKGGAAALLQAKLPNPTWFRGNMGVHFNLLGGLVKGNMRFKFTVGEECELMLPGTSPIDIMMISDLSPSANSSEVNVFTAPQLALSMPVQKSFEVDMDDGMKAYRINLNKFIVKDGSNIIDGRIEWNKDNTVATFYPHEILPPDKQLKMEVAVGFEEMKNGQWVTTTTAGAVAQETRDITFTTGSAPDYVPMENIVYAYPMVDQQYYYINESKTGKGYVQLKFGQEYLFPTNWKYKLILTDGAGNQKKEIPFTYDAGNKRLNFDMPTLDRGSRFEIGFLSESPVAKTEQQETSKETVLLDEEENRVVQESAKSGLVVQEGSKLLLNYHFASSKYSTFGDKIKNIRSTSNAVVYNDSYIFQLSQGIQLSEMFEDAEIYGTLASGNRPLVRIKAVLDDKYYKEYIHPLIYQGYPQNGITLRREDDHIGIPPINAFEGKVQGDYFPFLYSLPKYYYYDFDEIRTKASNRGVDHPSREIGYYPDVISGKYKAELQYYLPGGEEGKSRVNFEYSVSK